MCNALALGRAAILANISLSDMMTRSLHMSDIMNECACVICNDDGSAYSKHNLEFQPCYTWNLSVREKL